MRWIIQQMSAEIVFGFTNIMFHCKNIIAFINNIECVFVVILGSK